MIRLHKAFAPVTLGLFLSLSGCTGVGPYNWSHVEQPHYESEYVSSVRHSPLEARYSDRLLARGVIRDHWNRARGFEEAGETEQAAAHYQEILRIQPRYAPAHHRLGVLATMWGRFGDADQHFRLARMLNKSELPEVESYETKNAIAEREAEERAKREIAAEQGRTRDRSGSYEYVQNSPSHHPTPVETEDEGYYSQDEPVYEPVASERPLRQLRTAVRRRTTEMMAPVRTAMTPGPNSVLRSTREQIARTIRPQASEDYYEEEARQREYYAHEEELEAEAPVQDSQWEEEQRRPATASRPTVRRTSAPVRSPSSSSSRGKSAALRPNQLRSSSYEAHYMAGAEERVADAYDDEVPTSSGTSGVRRTSNYELERFEDEFPTRPMTRRAQLAAEPAEAGPEQWEATARIEQRVEELPTKQPLPTTTDRDRHIADQAERLEAEVAVQVREEVEASFSDRRVEVAREQLQRAQQQLVEAMVAAEQGGPGEKNKAAYPAQAPARGVPANSSKQRQAPSAPRKLHVSQASADESSEAYSLYSEPDHEVEEELVVIPQNAGQAAANAPATVSAVIASPAGEELPAVQVQRVIVPTSHQEVVLPGDEAFDTDTDGPVDAVSDLYEYAQSTRTREDSCKSPSEASVRRPQADQAGEAEPLVNSLDEQTLHRREMRPLSSFNKKAPEVPGSMIYR